MCKRSIIMAKLTKIEREHWYQYSKVREGGYTNRCKIDECCIHMSNSYEHELSKFNIFWKLRKQGSRVITECWDKEGNRRDLVDISNNEVYEIEKYGTGKGRGHRHPASVNVYFYDKQKWRNISQTPLI